MSSVRAAAGAVACLLFAVACGDNAADTRTENCALEGDEDESGAADCADPACAGFLACVDIACGNGLLEAGEACEDGNAADGDGCSSTCQLEACGDGARQPSEGCDDGNRDDDDGCSAACLVEACGDGVVQASEDCDDGNDEDDDGCDEDCELEACGDGVVQASEDCDDGDTEPGDGCSAVCTDEACGTGTIDYLEECDDDNLTDGDGCSGTCTLEACGNGRVEARTADLWDPATIVGLTFAYRVSDCVDGQVDLTFVVNGHEIVAATSATCACDDVVQSIGTSDPDVLASLADGPAHVEVHLAADDGEAFGWAAVLIARSSGAPGLATFVLGDPALPGAAAAGTVDLCGGPSGSLMVPGAFDAALDLVIETPTFEGCDDGNDIDDDGCDVTCVVSGCGNGYQTASEACDDGNLDDGDGCDSDCTPTGCGNGIVTDGEACDDGNEVEGDGCTSACAFGCLEDIDAAVTLDTGTGCYYRYDEALDWAGAEAACVTRQAHLVSIGSDLEQANLLSLGAITTWIGLTDAVTEGTWAWSDGSPLAFESWSDSQPDGGASENCALSFGSSVWHDFPCDALTVQHYVCERVHP